ncbi:Alpha/Beta hydrolase protein [Phycomyces nitens]|nr:Alpha/Beta hydrolase protein [Phycomyces nitens]
MSEIAVTGDQENLERAMPDLTTTWSHPFRQGFAPIKTKDSQTMYYYYYELHGTGPRRVVFIMGLNSPCQAWDYQVGHFAAMDEYTVLVFDSRGVGWTDGGWDSYNTTDWANDFVGLLDHLEWKSNVDAVGYSAGGQVLLKALLQQDPTRFRSAALLCTTAGGTRPWTGAYTLVSNMWKKPNEQVARLIRINYKEEWLNTRPDDGCTFETNFEKIRNLVKERNSRSRPQSLGGMVSQAVASMRHWVTAKELERIRLTGIPILVVTNGWDNFVHSSHSEYLQKHLQPKSFVVFEDSGHVVPTAKYEQINQMLEVFWKQE